MSLEILYSVLSLQYGMCGDIFRLLYMYFDSSFLPPSAPQTKKLKNHTTKPHATTVGRRVLWVFFGVVGLFEEKKNHSLESGWFLERSLMHEI